MTGSDAALLALVVASALHLGFQLTVTMVVYPTLARVDHARWDLAHARHSRGITPLVVLTYGALALSAAWALLTLLDGGATDRLRALGAVVSFAGAALAVVTALG